MPFQCPAWCRAFFLEPYLTESSHKIFAINLEKALLLPHIFISTGIYSLFALFLKNIPNP
ncbi:MAG: hypothetical protein EBQ67_00900 [Sphingobacteriia bacterium]|nr:hypothetical protein [Sphingobacteriia bacterium]NDC72843.1 hypothetical protein [Sphingobacteriia bacterium]